MDDMSGPFKILIIRFSAFGDIIQSLNVPSKIKITFPNSDIHWATRSDMVELLRGHPCIEKIWPFEKKQGFKGLIRFALALRRQKFTHIYDAHNNLRSHIISFILRPTGFLSNILFVRKSAFRFRMFLLFNFSINKFEMPFSGQRDFLAPLKKWSISNTLPAAPQLFVSEEEKNKALEILNNDKDWIALAPSASYDLKRWPIEHWKSLILMMPKEKFILLGGPEDHFLKDIERVAPERIQNRAGKISLATSVAIVSLAKVVISNDTWTLHAAEQMGVPAIALIGPTPFGYPSRNSTVTLEKNLSCKPCSKYGKGRCKNKNIFKQCMVDITPEEVSAVLKMILVSKVKN